VVRPNVVQLTFCVLALAFGSACGRAVRDAGSGGGASAAVAGGGGSGGDVESLDSRPSDPPPGVEGFGASELSPERFAAGDTDTLLADTSSLGNSLDATKTSSPANLGVQASPRDAGNASVPASLAASNAVSRDLESVRSAMVMQSPAANEKTGLLSAAAMNAVVSIYQAAGMLAPAGAARIESSSRKAGPQDSKNGTVTRTGGISGDWSPASPSSSSTGGYFQFPVDSAPSSWADEPVNTGPAPNAWWQAAVAGLTGDAQNQSEISFRIPVTDTPMSGSPDPALDPVPEPSQIVLMFTVIALVVLVAKRSALTRLIALHTGHRISR
jgi:hypothetical protein